MSLSDVTVSFRTETIPYEVKIAKVGCFYVAMVSGIKTVVEYSEEDRWYRVGSDESLRNEDIEKIYSIVDM